MKRKDYYNKEKFQKSFLLSIPGAIIALLLLRNLGWALPIARIDVLNPPIYPEQRFQIDIVAEGVESSDEVLSFGFDLDFDLSWSLDLDNDVEMGSGFEDNSDLFPATVIAGMAFPGLFGGSDILLASLFFTPHQAGTFNFSIISDIDDPNEGLSTWYYYYDLLDPSNSQIDITTSTSVSVVPEPGSGLLLLLGLGFGFILWNRKRAY